MVRHDGAVTTGVAESPAAPPSRAALVAGAAHPLQDAAFARPQTAPLKIAVGIATRGRPKILAETLEELTRQTRAPDRTLISHVTEADVAALPRQPGLEFLSGLSGLTHQRNAILDAVDDCDMALFLDDDFLAAPGYVEATLAAFATDPGVVVTTGQVLADGAKGPGIGVGEGRALLARHAAMDEHAPSDGRAAQGLGMTPTFNGYGCNMAIRLDTARAYGIRFDERLPLYAWYEDIDFTRRLGRHGAVVRVEAACGVHLGVKAGRTTGRRLGYSQVANPLYLWRKGSYPLDHALRSIGRNVLANGARSLLPEPWVDRRGRLRGNALALLDALRGRVTPERVLEL